MIRKDLNNISDLERSPANVEGESVEEDHCKNTSSYSWRTSTSIGSLLIESGLESCPDYDRYVRILCLRISEQ
jgi:hypothetical protein